MGLPFLSSRVCVSTDTFPSSFTLTLRSFLTLMTNINVATATKLDLLIADTQGQIKYTVLKPSKRGVKALSGKRAWANAAPKGSFMHGSVEGTPGVTSNNKCNKVM